MSARLAYTAELSLPRGDGHLDIKSDRFGFVTATLFGSPAHGTGPRPIWAFTRACVSRCAINHALGVFMLHIDQVDFDLTRDERARAEELLAHAEAQRASCARPAA